MLISLFNAEETLKTFLTTTKENIDVEGFVIHFDSILDALEAANQNKCFGVQFEDLNLAIDLNGLVWV